MWHLNGRMSVGDGETMENESKIDNSLRDDDRGGSPKLSQTEHKVTQATDDTATPKRNGIWTFIKGLNWKVKLVLGAIVLFVIGSAFGGSGGKQAESNAPVSKSETVALQPEKKVDKSSLAATINQYGATAGDGYTPESFQVFSDALAKAKQVNEDESATQDDVDTANSRLLLAFGSLKEAFNPDNYSWPTYKEVARNPDNYKGQKVAFTGRVLQVLEGTEENKLRVATDGSYDDVIIVGYAPDLLGGTHILEDDNVTVYGECVGQFTYSTAIGSQMSLPGVYAAQITIN